MKKFFLLLLASTIFTYSFAQKRKGSTYVKSVNIKPILDLDYKTRNANLLLTGPVQTEKSATTVTSEFKKTCITLKTDNPFIKAELTTSEITPRYDKNGKFLISTKIFLMVNYEAVLVIKNSSNEILATKQLYVKGSDDMGIPVLDPTTLVGLSNNNMNSFNEVVTKSTQKLNDRTIEKAVTALRRYFCGFYGADTMAVYSGKGKLFDYTELDAAQETMKLTTKDIGLKKEDTISTKANLIKLIEIWEKEIATADLTNPEARISLEVYRGLQYNVATAYYFLKEYEKAELHAKIARFDPEEKDQKIKVTNDFEKKAENLLFFINMNLYF